MRLTMVNGELNKSIMKKQSLKQSKLALNKALARLKASLRARK